MQNNISYIILIFCLIAACAFEFINGFHDTANAIATCVSTRALSVKAAIFMAAVLNFAGAMVSTKVAATIGKGIVDAKDVTQMVIFAGVMGAIIWDLITWYWGLPSSSSHALIGGVIGAVVAHAGSAALHWAGLKKIILALILSPIVGAALGLAAALPAGAQTLAFFSTQGTAPAPPSERWPAASRSCSLPRRRSRPPGARTIATLIMSAAVPWIGLFTAMRSPMPRWTGRP